MYTVLYFVDRHDELYGPSHRQFADKDQALQAADHLGGTVYDPDGRQVTADQPVKAATKATSQEKTK